MINLNIYSLIFQHPPTLTYKNVSRIDIIIDMLLSILRKEKSEVFSHFSSYCCLGTNFREWLNIQNRDPFPSGPSLINS